MAVATAPKKQSIASTKNPDGMSRTYIWTPTRELINVTDFNNREDYGTEKEQYDLAIFVKNTVLRTGTMPYPFFGQLVEDKQSVNLLDGFRRTKAYDQLLADPAKFELSEGDIEKIQGAKFNLFLESKDASVGQMLARQISANSSKHFAPYEQAKVIAAMEEFGMDRQEIHELTGLSKTVICDRLKLIRIDQSTAEFVQENGISATATSHAVSQAREVEPAEQAAVVQEILSEAHEEAKTEKRSVSKSHVEAAARKVLPAPVAPPSKTPEDRSQLTAICDEFSDWHKIPGKQLRQIVAIINKVPASGELPQPKSKIAAL